MEILSEVDLDLAYLSEKLVNLHVLLTRTLGWDDFEEMDGMCISDEFIERVLVFDFLSSVLEGEVFELERNLGILQAKLLDVRQMISLCTEEGDMFGVMGGKLCDSEGLWEQFRDGVTEMKILSGKLRLSMPALLNCKQEDGGVDIVEAPAFIISKSQLLTGHQQRHILQMLEKSLAGELDIERKYLDTVEHEEELQLKLRCIEQVVVRMKEASEAAWEKSLKAHNTAEVLFGTSRESLSRLQHVQFNLNLSLQRENDLRRKLENCTEHLKFKEESIQKLQKQIEMLSLHEKVRSLETKLKDSENRNRMSTVIHKGTHSEVNYMVDALRETKVVTEIRVEHMEARLSTLAETNLELMDELRFLKSNHPNAEKVTLLRNQLRDLEIQLQHAKAAAAASQEKHNMSYGTILVMETLIGNLESKVSKYKSTEAQCLQLSESNFELNKEKTFLKERLEFIESSLEVANSKKLDISADINSRSKQILNMVAQIHMERARIEKQLTILTEENKKLSLAHKLQQQREKTAD